MLVKWPLPLVAYCVGFSTQQSYCKLDRILVIGDQTPVPAEIERNVAFRSKTVASMLARVTILRIVIVFTNNVSKAVCDRLLAKASQNSRVDNVPARHRTTRATPTW